MIENIGDLINNIDEIPIAVSKMLSHTSNIDYSDLIFLQGFLLKNLSSVKLSEPLLE